MLNPYIKHGTFLVEFDDRINTIQGNWFFKIRNKTIIYKKWLRKYIIPLMLKDDVTFKGVVSWFQNTT
jgi:hypothetical protein